MIEGRPVPPFQGCVYGIRDSQGVALGWSLSALRAEGRFIASPRSIGVHRRSSAVSTRIRDRGQDRDRWRQRPVRTLPPVLPCLSSPPPSLGFFCCLCVRLSSWSSSCPSCLRGEVPIQDGRDHKDNRDNRDANKRCESSGVPSCQPVSLYRLSFAIGVHRRRGLSDTVIA